MKIIFSIIFIGIVIISGSGMLTCTGFTESSLEIAKEFCKSFNLTSTNVTIYLDENGISYGHVLLWKANTTGTNYEESAVVYLDGIAYIGSCSTHGDGYDKLFAVDTTNGETLWSKHTGPGYVGPVIDNDVIYLGTSSHGYDPTNEYVYAINRFNGTEIWRRNIFGGIPESIQFDNDKIYFTSDVIYALDKDDGTTNWTYQMDSFSVTKPILKDNAFYTATSGRKMYKVDVSDGSKIWDVTLSDFSWDNSITADGDGHIFLALYGDETINAYNENDGSLIWTYILNGPSLSFNAFHNNMVFIADTYGYVYALNSTTGSLIWETKIGDTIDISSPTLSGGLLFIGTRDFDESAFFALNEINGAVLWKYPIDASVTAPPSVADGMMLCGTDDWFMYAFDFGIGSGNWPLHRYDSYNTAWSPDGLTKWQFVEANCSTNMNITTCIVTNYYDHDVSNVMLKLDEYFKGNWYDSLGNLLKTDSNNYVIESLSNSSLTLYISTDHLYPPNKPDIPSGPRFGKTGEIYNYSTRSDDPDGDVIFYFFDWGDGSDSGWLGPYSSGKECPASHVWIEKGNFEVKVKAKDTNSLQSEWSDPLPISMPLKHQTLLQLIIGWILQIFWITIP